jgi:hypothetical protein
MANDTKTDHQSHFNLTFKLKTQISEYRISGFNISIYRTGLNRTRATCMAGSVARRLAIHYAFGTMVYRVSKKYANECPHCLSVYIIRQIAKFRYLRHIIISIYTVSWRSQVSILAWFDEDVISFEPFVWEVWKCYETKGNEKLEWLYFEVWTDFILSLWLKTSPLVLELSVLANFLTNKWAKCWIFWPFPTQHTPRRTLCIPRPDAVTKTTSFQKGIFTLLFSK